MSSKSKSSETEASNNKTSSSPATPRVSKLGSRGGAFKSDADSPSPLQKPRLSVDQSPKSVTSRPVSARPAKPSTTPDKHPTRVGKGPELQAQLTAVQEDLKKAKEKLASSEKEKAKALEEAKEAKRLAEEANEKLREAFAAQKRAEEDSEIEKFRALEIEQVTIETDQKRDEKWKKELESVRHQHALDLSALLSTTEELQRVKQELAMTTDTKNQALTHADDATKIAEIHAEKMEILSAELARVKASMESKLGEETNEKNELISQLNSDMSKRKLELEKMKLELDKETNEKNELISQLNLEMSKRKLELEKMESELDKETNEKNELIFRLTSEMNNRKLELEKIKIYEEKLGQKEDCIEQLNVEIEAAKMASSYNRNLAEEWMDKAEALEIVLEQANRKERSAFEDLQLVSEKLKESNTLLNSAESEIYLLNGKVELLEITVNRQQGDIKESEDRLEMAKGEAADMAKKVEFLESELEMFKEKNLQALTNEKIAAASFQNLLEEKNLLEKELENLSDENEKNKGAMESLASALHEVSTEARETKEKLSSTQKENTEYESEIEDLKITLKSTNEKYEEVIGEAKSEIDILNNSIKLSKEEYQSLKEEWEKKELNFMDGVKQSEEERSSLEREIGRLMTLLREKEEKATVMEEEGALMVNKLTEAQSEIMCLKAALEEEKSEGIKSKEILLNRDNEIQSLIHESEELRTRESASLKKIEELSKLLEESMAKEKIDENGEISDSEKEYDMLPKVVEFSEQNGDGKEDNHKTEDNVNLSDDEVQSGTPKFGSFNGRNEDKKTNGKQNDSVQVDSKMWESCKIEENEFSLERNIEQELVEGEEDTKIHVNGISSAETQENGETSPLEQQSQKKKKPLLKKFGSLLKKKGTNSHK